MKLLISTSRQRPNISTRPSDYLVVEDREDKSTWHLPVRRRGEYDRRLLGAAYAALFSNYRGNPYQGPDKEQAKKKLLAIYNKLGLEIPS